MAVPSRVGELKIVSPITAFVLNTLTLKQGMFFRLVHANSCAWLFTPAWHTCGHVQKFPRPSSLTVRTCLHGGGRPQIGEVTCGGSPYLSCKHDQIKMRDYKDRRVTPPKRVTSHAWGPPPPCKQAVSLLLTIFSSVRQEDPMKLLQ